MSDRIRILIVDDIPETREHLAKLLGFESDMEVVGAAESGPEALELASRLTPDVVLMDINMPGMDGIVTSEQLSARVPSAAVIMMSVQGEADYLRRSMLAGAREFLVKPFSADELTTSIRKVHERETEKQARAADRVEAAASAARAAEGRHGSHRCSVVTIFSPKGGVGRTTIAVNLAVAAAKQGRRVALVDGSLQFGDVAVMLNLDPRHRSLADLVPEIAAGVPGVGGDRAGPPRQRGGRAARAAHARDRGAHHAGLHARRSWSSCARTTTWWWSTRSRYSTTWSSRCSTSPTGSWRS